MGGAAAPAAQGRAHASPAAKGRSRGDRRRRLLAIEGERDDISGMGQTRAGLTLASKLPDTHKKYLMAEHVGHYGIFNGRRWREEIAPVVDAWIATHAR